MIVVKGWSKAKAVGQQQGKASGIGVGIGVTHMPLWVGLKPIFRSGL